MLLAHLWRRCLARPTGHAQLSSEDAEGGRMQNTPDSMELVLEHSPARTPRTPSAADSFHMSEVWSSPDSGILATVDRNLKDEKTLKRNGHIPLYYKYLYGL